MAILNLEQWNDWLAATPHAHLLQMGEWGALKSGFGWQAQRVVVGNAGAQILFRRLPLGFSIGYVPKGPLGTGWAQLWPEVDLLCRKLRTIFLKVEPDGWEPTDLSAEFKGWSPAASIQPRRTICIDLSGSEEDILQRMKQKTRYNIHLAEKKEVVIQQSTDLVTFSKLMKETGVRDGFGVHSLAYYQQAYDSFYPLGKCALFHAKYQDLPLAGLMVFRQGSRAWYVYGASGEQERNRMPAYLLQWEAMRWARNQGCTEYDLWGVPDEEEATLEEQFTERSGGLWGVYRFKRGFGGQLMCSPGAWDRIYSKPLYALYRLYTRRSVEAGG